MLEVDDLKRVRLKFGFSTEDVAAELKLPVSRIIEWERGDYAFKPVEMAFWKAGLNEIVRKKQRKRRAPG